MVYILLKINIKVKIKVNVKVNVNVKVKSRSESMSESMSELKCRRENKLSTSYKHQAGLWIKINMKPFPNDETLAIAQQTVIREFMRIMSDEDVDFDDSTLEIIYHTGGMRFRLLDSLDQRKKIFQPYSTMGIRARVNKKCSIDLAEGMTPNPHGELNL